MNRTRNAWRAATLGLLIGLAMAWPSQVAKSAPRPSGSSSAPSPPQYDTWFTDEAMRVDLIHTGTRRENLYSIDEVVQEPVWPGTRRYLIDPFGYGSYRFRIMDAATGREIFRQGYSTLFEEWAGTPEASTGVRRSMSESVRFPWPRKPVVLYVERRGKRNKYKRLFKLPIDPASHLIPKSRPFASFDLVELGGGHSPENALDIVIVPEGYAETDADKLRADLQRFARAFLGSEPFASLASSIHVRGVLAFSRESGISEPRKGIFRDTILGASFNTFDSPRYLTVPQTKRVRQIAALAPYDSTFIMVNSARYGGGGVYNQWSVFTSDNEYDEYLMLHEYGHHMGGLGDEYYSSAISTDEDAMYPPGQEPWEPNITAFLGKKREAIKWHSLIAARTPLPTPEDDAHSKIVGLFEGAGYKAKGLYRPQRDCKMFHKGLVGFCEVCRRSLKAMVSYYAGQDLEP